MIDALRILELIEHGEATNHLIEEHQKGLERAYAMRLSILHALVDAGMRRSDAAKALGMTRARVSTILRRDET